MMTSRPRILVIGAGGIGVPALWTLLVNKFFDITVFDPDRVELSNLHRQIFYTEADIGRPKVEALHDFILKQKLIPATAIYRLKTYECLLNAQALEDSSIEKELHETSIWIDATDGTQTKFWIHDLAQMFGKILIHAGVEGLKGNVLRIDPEKGPCLYCLFPDAVSQQASCEDSGIVGPLAGLVGARTAERACYALFSNSGKELTKEELGHGYMDVFMRPNSPDLSWMRTFAFRGLSPNTCTHLKEISTLQKHSWALTENADQTILELDLRGLVCPQTYTETRKYLEPKPLGSKVRLLIGSDESARRVPLSLVAAGYRILSVDKVEGVHHILIEC